MKMAATGYLSLIGESEYQVVVNRKKSQTPLECKRHDSGEQYAVLCDGINGLIRIGKFFQFVSLGEKRSSSQGNIDAMPVKTFPRERQQENHLTYRTAALRVEVGL